MCRPLRDGEDVRVVVRLGQTFAPDFHFSTAAASGARNLLVNIRHKHVQRLHLSTASVCKARNGIMGCSRDDGGERPSLRASVWERGRVRGVTVARMTDVAARAGVSAQTVSRVLRGHTWVAPETAARVRQAMQDLGYHNNELAGALKRGRSRTLGLLFPMHTMSIWSEVAEGAEELAHERGYPLLLSDTGESLEREANSLSLLLSHRVSGIVYVEPQCRLATQPCSAALVASGLPVVVISAEQDDLPSVHLRTDDERAGYVAMRHLLELGLNFADCRGERVPGHGLGRGACTVDARPCPCRGRAACLGGSRT